MGVVAAGERVEKQDGVALVGIQRAVGFVCKLDTRQGFTVVEGEIADGEDVGADVLAHGWQMHEKRPGRMTPVFSQSVIPDE